MIFHQWTQFIIPVQPDLSTSDWYLMFSAVLVHLYLKQQVCYPSKVLSCSVSTITRPLHISAAVLWSIHSAQEITRQRRFWWYHSQRFLLFAGNHDYKPSPNQPSQHQHFRVVSVVRRVVVGLFSSSLQLPLIRSKTDILLMGCCVRKTLDHVSLVFTSYLDPWIRIK